MSGNIIDIKVKLNKQDLELFARQLMEQVISLQVENAKLVEKVEHLEEMLMYADIPEIGK